MYAAVRNEFTSFEGVQPAVEKFQAEQCESYWKCNYRPLPCQNKHNLKVAFSSSNLIYHKIPCIHACMKGKKERKKEQDGYYGILTIDDVLWAEQQML